MSTEAKRAVYEASMRALVSNIRATTAAFMATAAASLEYTPDEAFEHAVLDESRAAFAPVLEHFGAGALQMLGIDLPNEET